MAVIKEVKDIYNEVKATTKSNISAVDRAREKVEKINKELMKFSKKQTLEIVALETIKAETEMKNKKVLARIDKASKSINAPVSITKDKINYYGKVITAVNKKIEDRKAIAKQARDLANGQVPSNIHKDLKSLASKKLQALKEYEFIVNKVGDGAVSSKDEPMRLNTPSGGGMRDREATQGRRVA